MTEPANKSEADRIKKRSKWRWLWAWMFYDAKWVFVAIFALMFALSVLYLAPLKVILLTGLLTFLTIIFTRRQRVIMWLCGWLLFWAVFTWSFIEGDSAGWRIWQFDDALAQLEAARAVPLQENASPLYDELFSRHDALFFDELFYRNDPQFLTVAEPWQSTQFPALAEWLNRNADSIELLVEATQKKYCRFTSAATPDELDDQMLRTNLTRRWAQMLLRSANNDLANGQTSRALTKQLAALKIADHEYQQKTMLDLPAGLNIELTALRSINGFIIRSDPDESYLRTVELSLVPEPDDWENDWQAISASQKLLAKNAVGMFYQVSDNEKVRFNRDIIKTLNTSANLKLRTSGLLPRLARVSIIFQWLILPSNPQKISDSIEWQFQKYTDIATAGADIEQLERGGFFNLGRHDFTGIADMLARRAVSYYYPLNRQHTKRITLNRATKLIIALRRYKNTTGRWPDRLDQLADSVEPAVLLDPLNNEPFIYKLDGTDFMLYSKGENNIDDKGLNVSLVGTDDFRIWPIELNLSQEDFNDILEQHSLN